MATAEALTAHYECRNFPLLLVKLKVTGIIARTGTITEMTELLQLTIVEKSDFLGSWGIITITEIVVREAEILPCLALGR